MATVTCRTEGCTNRDQPIDLELTFELDGQVQTVEAVVCGACGQPITDIA